MIFLGIIYEPLSEPPVTKICEWGPWGLKALFLAPACFYSTSMTCLTLSSNVRLFIDDTTVHLTIHSDADSQVLQKHLDKLANWEILWKMKLHPDKSCKVLRVGRKHALMYHDYILHGQISKYLGVATILPIYDGTNMSTA